MSVQKMVQYLYFENPKCQWEETVGGGMGINS